MRTQWYDLCRPSGRPLLPVAPASAARAPVVAAPPSSAAAVAGLVALALCLADLVFRPYGPDLSAQIARAGAAARGVTVWWSGWFGGTNVATYSLLSGPAMQHLGVAGGGMLACVAIGVLGADLLRDAERPMLGGAAVATAAGFNLFSGRVTFALGMVVALAALALYRRQLLLPGLAVAAMSGLASPLAALFVVIAGASLAVVDRRQRLRAVALCVVSAAPVVLSAALMGGPSVMPFGADVLIPALLSCSLLIVAPVPRVIRVGAAFAAAVACGAFLVPTAIGSTATRVPMLAAAPLLLATARISPPRLLAGAALLAIWPVGNLVTDLRPADDPSTTAAYYQPLLEQLPPAGVATQRLEVVDPKSHGSDAFLPARVPLARGWLRADDFAANGLFYAPHLSAGDYLQWLRERAVGWVALPDAPLDYGAVTEGGLVAGGLPYLHQVWQDQHWRLFRVSASTPIASGAARVTGMTDTSVELTARSAGVSYVRLPYSRLLSLRDASGRDVGCVTASPDSSGTVLWIPSPGRYRLAADLDVFAPSAGHC